MRLCVCVCLYDLVLVSSWFLEVAVSAALAVVFSVSLPFSVPVFLFGGFGGRAGGQDVVPDVVKDAGHRHTQIDTVSVTEIRRYTCTLCCGELT